MASHPIEITTEITGSHGHNCRYLVLMTRLPMDGESSSFSWIQNFVETGISEF